MDTAHSHYLKMFVMINMELVAAYSILEYKQNFEHAIDR